MVEVTVFVMPKPTVLDPQGKAVHHALESLGYSEVEDVRIGKRVVLQMESEDTPELRARIEKFCDELLSNPVIEDFTYEVRPLATS